MKKMQTFPKTKRLCAFVCLIFLFGAFAWAQKTVTGTVLDTSGEPIIGANVVINGTTQGVTTDIDGNFSLTGVAESAVLHVTFIGYAAQDVAVKGQTKLSITLSEEQDMLDEVVVVGYGVQKKRDLTGAIASVKNDDIVLSPLPNPVEALQGKVAGLDITRSSGQAGASASMKLRGTRSINASSDGNDEPLVLIDGLPGSLTTLNPNDIESIEVLKDASSTAVYGASGANGVIIVTTKGGSAGKTTVNFNAYAGFNGWSKTPKMYNGKEFFELKKNLQISEGKYTTDEDVFSTAIYNAYQNGESTDWADELLETGYTQNYSLSVSGGNDKTTGYVSLNYSGEKGQYANDDYRVYSTNIKVDHKVKSWLSIGANVQGSFTYKNSAYAKLETALIKNPIGSAYDEDGNVNVFPIAGDTDFVNLLVNNHSNYRNNTQNTRLYLTPYLRINPVKGLTLESRVNVSLNYNKSNKFEGLGSYKYYSVHPEYTGTETCKEVYASVANTNSYNYTWENILTYNFKLADAHDFTFTGVTTWSHSRSEYTYAYADNLTANEYLWHYLGAGQNQKNESSYTMKKSLGFVYRLNYSYKGRYLASVSARHDGCSVLAEDHRWDFFPAYSLGWRISDESFMESTEDWLDNLKIRFGQGITGTSNITPYMTYNTIEQSYAILGNEYQLSYNYPQNIVDPNLGWEKSYNTNIGLDMAVLNNRIDVNIDYYHTSTKDIIWSALVPVTNGSYNSSTQFRTTTNICESKNNGIELAITGRPFMAQKAGDFSWTVSATYTHSSEELTFLDDGMDQYINGNKILKKGEPINSFYGYKLAGTWTTAEAEDATVFNAKPGDLKIVCAGVEKVADGQFRELKTDTDGNEYYVYYDATNKCTATDYQQVLGHTQPDWTLGLKNSFTYKGFDLSVYCYWRFGQTINYSMLGRYSTNLSNNFPKYFDYATPETLDRSHTYPLLTTAQPFNQMDGNGGITYVDGSFFKVKNITLGYTVPAKLTRKAGIESARIYGTITNPIVVAHSDLIEDYDPEMNGDLDYPLTKQLVFGINVQF